MNLESLVEGLAHVGIRVHDLKRARKFYELLGFQFVAGPIGPEPVAILSHPSGLEINLILNAGQATAPNILMDVPEKHAGYTHIALIVSDIQAARAALAAAGLPLSGHRGPSEDHAVALFLRDPDRNVVELALRGK
jgi:lactoylglutathione lyase